MSVGKDLLARNDKANCREYRRFELALEKETNCISKQIRDAEVHCIGSQQLVSILVFVSPITLSTSSSFMVVAYVYAYDLALVVFACTKIIL